MKGFSQTKFAIRPHQIFRGNQKVNISKDLNTNDRYVVSQIKAILEMVRGIKTSNTKHVPLSYSLN